MEIRWMEEDKWHKIGGYMDVIRLICLQMCKN
jgi:hypothetical protein